MWTGVGATRDQGADRRVELARRSARGRDGSVMRASTRQVRARRRVDGTEEALDAIRAAMEAAGGSMADVAKLTVNSVAHAEDRHADLAAEVKAAFDPGLAETCTIVPSTQSGTDADRLVEIEAIGVLPPADKPNLCLGGTPAVNRQSRTV